MFNCHIFLEICPFLVPLCNYYTQFVIYLTLTKFLEQKLHYFTLSSMFTPAKCGYGIQCQCTDLVHDACFTVVHDHVYCFAWRAPHSHTEHRLQLAEGTCWFHSWPQGGATRRAASRWPLLALRAATARQAWQLHQR